MIALKSNLNKLAISTLEKAMVKKRDVYLKKMFKYFSKINTINTVSGILVLPILNSIGIIHSNNAIYYFPAFRHRKAQNVYFSFFKLIKFKVLGFL